MAYILIIDDDEDFSSAARMVLLDAGHDVEVKHAPEQGLESLERRKPDLVLLDVMFPEDSSAGLKIARSEQLRGIPVILLTSVNARFPLGVSADDIDDSQLPARDFLEKPVDLEMLKSRVAALLAKAGRQRCSAQQPGPAGAAGGLKLAVSGKGGSGKTTLVAVLAKIMADQGKMVLAIDADPASNLASALGIENASDLTPLAEMEDLIAERTGSSGGAAGAMFKMNPQVSDLPEKFWVERDGVRLLVLGGIQKGGGGCACPENAFLKTLLGHLMLQRDEVVVADMAAGVEHLGRATVEGVDALLVLVKPSQRSAETARRVARLAQEIGIQRVFVVGNKVRKDAHRQFVQDAIPGAAVLGCLSYNEQTLEADLAGRPAYDDNDMLLAEATAIMQQLEARLAS